LTTVGGFRGLTTVGGFRGLTTDGDLEGEVRTYEWEIKG